MAESVTLACQPVNPSTAFRAAAEGATGVPLRPYAGSVEAACFLCGCGVWVGPLQQQKLRDLSPAPRIACLECLARAGVVSTVALSLKKWGE